MNPGPPVGKNPSWKVLPDPQEETLQLLPLWRKQLPLLSIVAFSLLVALAASPMWGRVLLSAIIWESPFYINPLITLALFLYVALGLALTSGPGDQGMPIYFALVALWIVWVTIEFSLILWFEMQMGLRTTASRVHLLAYAACACAIGATVLLHVNQLNRRLLLDLRDRGINPEQLRSLEGLAATEARKIVLQLVGLAVAASFVLWLGDLIIGGTRLGLNVLGILAGLIIMSVLLVYSYSVLKKGPLLDNEGATASTFYPGTKSEDPEQTGGGNGRSGP